VGKLPNVVADGTIDQMIRLTALNESPRFDRIIPFGTTESILTANFQPPKDQMLDPVLGKRLLNFIRQNEFRPRNVARLATWGQHRLVDAYIYTVAEESS
jgi:hypothetical protein